MPARRRVRVHLLEPVRIDDILLIDFWNPLFTGLGKAAGVVSLASVERHRSPIFSLEGGLDGFPLRVSNEGLLRPRVGWKMGAKLCYLHDREVRSTSLERRL